MELTDILQDTLTVSPAPVAPVVEHAPQTVATHHHVVTAPAPAVADSLAADSLAADSLAAVDSLSVPVAVKDTVVVEPPTGFVGTPVSYEFRNDDFVTSLLLVSFFIMAWVIARSWKFLRGQFRDFFYVRERPNLFAEREDTVLRGRGFLVVQTCFLVALVYFALSRELLPDVFGHVSPYVMLAAGTLFAGLYYLLKIGLYAMVNPTFFAPAKCKLWRDTYLVSVLITGCGLLPLVLLLVFFDLSIYYGILGVVLFLSVIKILLLYKCYRIFFNSWLGRMHIILYFCALEIIPLGFFLAALFTMSSNLPAF